MKKYRKYLVLLAIQTLLFFSMSCILSSFLEVIGIYVETIDPEQQEMDLLYSLSLTQTAIAVEGTTPEAASPETARTQFPTLTPESRMVTVTLISENCTDQYFFADGEWVAFVVAYGTSTFEIKAGEHMLQACMDLERATCGAAGPANFTQNTDWRIYAHPSCNP